LCYKEYEFFVEHGSEQLEDLLEQRDVDVVNVFRTCCLELN